MFVKLWPAAARVALGVAAMAVLVAAPGPAFADITGYNPSTSTASGTGTAGNLIRVTRLRDGVEMLPACSTVVVGGTWSCTFTGPLGRGTWVITVVESIGIEVVSTTTLIVVIDPGTLPLTPAGHPLPFLAAGAALIAAGALLVRRTRPATTLPPQ